MDLDVVAIGFYIADLLYLSREDVGVYRMTKMYRHSVLFLRYESSVIRIQNL